MEDLIDKMYEAFCQANQENLTRSEVNALSDKVKDLKGYGHVVLQDDKSQFVVDSMSDKIQWLLCHKLIEAFDREK